MGEASGSWPLWLGLSDLSDLAKKPKRVEKLNERSSRTV